MKRTATFSILAQLAAALLILLFVYTATSKLLDHENFERTLRRSPLLKSTAGFVSIVLPIAELLISGLLFFPKTRLKGLFYSSLLLVLLTGYLLYMVLFTPDLPCSCGGVLKWLNWKEHIFFNLCFTTLALAGWLAHKATLSIAIHPVSPYRQA